MNRKTILNSIAESFSRFKSEVEILSKEGLYDVNLHSENVLIPLLNHIYGLNLVNANSFKRNFPGIDLIDKDNRIAYQITSTANITKVKHTLKEFLDNSLDKDIDFLFIFILTKKQSSYKEDGLLEIIGARIEFDPKKHIIDTGDLFSMLNTTLQLEKMRVVMDLLKEEFSDFTIAQRKQLAQNQEEIISESIFPNILEIIIPEQLHIAEVGIDRDEIIKRSWETENKLKKQAPTRKVAMRALSMSGKKVVGDWHIFEDKIISFRDFHDGVSNLNILVSPGTSESIKTHEFCMLGKNFQKAIKQLIFHCLREKLYKKYIRWIGEGKIFRFSPDKKIPGIRKISWKNKKSATRKVVDTLLNEERAQIISYKHLAFKHSIQYFESKWYLGIVPTWSYTWNGYDKSKLEPTLLSGIKRLENNKSVYMSFRFIAYVLINTLPEETENYDLISFSQPFYDTIIFSK